jgi:asparagine synthase (glutamine-hydrolysing)
LCGIAGIAGHSWDKMLIPTMLEMMRHRGPDSVGYYARQNIEIGHCRLSINDLSERAKQPFVSADGKVAVAINGEIYNFNDIKTPLLKKGYRFQSESDCEVVLHAYMDRGINCVSELNGMFAIAIWDDNSQLLYLVRDRLGIKPLYYSLTRCHLVFASEIKALAQSESIDLTMDAQSFVEYLAFENYFFDRTLNKHIRLVEPGEIIQFEHHNGMLKKRKYWQPQLSTNSQNQAEDFCDQYVEISQRSVDRHLISDVPLASYLSAGIDSSTVAFWASKRLKGDLKTYTGYFGLLGFYDEATDAARVAKHYGCSNERVEITPQDFTSEIENVLYHLDEPRVGMGSFSQYMVAKRAAQEVKVILTGHGGDELFAGYPVFKSIQGKKNILQFIYHSSLRDKMFFVYFAILPLIKKELRFFLPNLFSLQLMKKCIKKDYYNSLIGQTNVFMAPEQLEKQAKTPYEQLFLTYLIFYLPSLFIVEDKISMAFSLESRTPLCDNEMLDFALSLSLSDKLTNNELKHIPRTAMKGRLPDFLYALPKRGFPTPLVLWFKKELRDFIKHFILDQVHYLDMFDKGQVEKIIADYQNTSFATPYDEIRAHRLWIIFNLIVYFKNVGKRFRN